MKEYNVSYKNIGKNMDYITFDRFVEQVTGESFSDIYNREQIIHEEKQHGRKDKSNVEWSPQWHVPRTKEDI